MSGPARNPEEPHFSPLALLLPTSNLPVPPSDFCSLIRSHPLKQWRESWNCETLNKLHAIEPKVNVFNLYRLPRRNEIIIHRLRIEHSVLTHSHSLHEETYLGARLVMSILQSSISYFLVYRVQLLMITPLL
jgi:hypothetical protein